MSAFRIWHFAVFCLVAVLVACGGGGGDDGEKAGFRVSFNTASLNFSYLEGSDPLAKLVIATAHGAVPAAGLYIGATVSGTGIQQPIYIAINEMDGTASASITPMHGLPAGVYSGTINLLACVDELCKSHYAGSPHKISYRITVRPRLKTDPVELTFRLLEKETGEAELINVTLPEGNTQAQHQLTYGPGASDWLQVQNNGSTLVITPKAANVAAGNYVANLILTADAGNQQLIVPISLLVAYDPQVHLSLNKSSISLAGPEGKLLPAETIQVHLPPASSGVATAVTYGGGASGWLQVQKSGSDLVLKASTVGLLPGSYSATLKVTDNLTKEVVTVPVSLSVAYDALMHLRVDQASLGFTGTETQLLSAKTLVFGLPPAASGLGTVINYGAGASGWLQLQTAGNALHVSVNTTGLTAGTYSADVTLKATGTSESLVVPVTLTISKGLLSLSSETVAINMGSAGNGSFLVQALSGVTTTQWSATSNQPWLILDGSSGVMGGAVQWHLDPVLFENLENNKDYVAVISVSASGLSGVSKQITVRKQFHEITHIDVLALAEGESGEVLLYGAGFASIGSFADRLYISGDLASEAITVRSNTVASVNFSNVPAGNYTIALKSVMGSMSHRNTLRVVAAKNYAYQVIPTSGKKGDLIWDPVTQSAFVPEKDLARIHRFQWNGTTFVHTAKSSSATYALGMTRDNGRLVASTNDGNIQFYDPATMELLSTLKIAGSLPSLPSLPLAISGVNDLWIATEPSLNSSSITLLKVNLDTGASQKIQSNSYSFYSGPWGVVSPNGNRMMMTQSASISPTPPLLLLDIMAGYFSMGTPYSFFKASSNRYGTRWLLDTHAIYNFGLDKQGNFPVPAGWFFREGVVSNDGTRVYMYAFANDSLGAVNDGESTTASRPRIYVYDINPLPPAQSNYPLLGYIEIADYSGCRGLYPNPCDFMPHIALSRDGRTFFAVGDRNFVVVPIPAAYQQGQPAAGGAAMVSVQASQAARLEPPAEMRRWHPR